MSEKSGCAKMMSAIWQFPVFTCAWMLVAVIAGIKMYAEAGSVETAVNDSLDIAGSNSSLDVTTGLLWTLIGICVIDGGITFMAVVTSKWVHDCCWDKQMDKCPCCTQFVCYILNWFLFGMAALLALISILVSSAGGFVILYAVMNRGVCDQRTVDTNPIDDNVAKQIIDGILSSLKTFVCEDGGGSKMNDCDDFPTSIDVEKVPTFCTGLGDIINVGGAFFAWVCVGIIAQWAFVTIQRANLVEGAIRRDMAKENNKEKAQDENYGTEINSGPNV